PFTSLRWMILTGEALPSDLCQRWLAWYPHIPILNAYGPTECSDDVTHYPVREGTGHNNPYLPIGYPVANTEIYVLDDFMVPLPVNIPGQLYVGGIGVGRGYLYNARQTAEVFVPHLFSREPGARLYRTGDLARYRADGSIEFLMRIDHQVKIRGFRIELGEIEAVLSQHPALYACTVIARTDHPGEKRLVAYLVLHEGMQLSLNEIRHYLEERLPDYMVPTAYMFLQALPLTANGKIDRQALPSPDGLRPSLDTSYVAPRTPVEANLEVIWARVLGLAPSQVGIHDNFFALGGDSILSIQIISQMHALGLQCTLQQLFQYQTIAQLAQVVTSHESQRTEQGPVTGDVPLTPIQASFFQQPLPNYHHWNQDALFEVKQPLDIDFLRQALQVLVEHHDALRLRFTPSAQGWSQHNAAIEDGKHFLLHQVDLSMVADSDLAARIEATAAEAQRSMHLSHGPLLYAVWMDCGSGRSGRLLLIIHHLVVDGVSWRILVEDLHTAYLQLQRQQPVQLPAKTTSFRQWAQRLTAYAQLSSLDAELAYWSGLPWKSLSPLPRDFAGSNLESDAQVYNVSLDPVATQALLQTVPAVYHTQIIEVLLTAL